MEKPEQLYRIIPHENRCDIWGSSRDYFQRELFPNGIYELCGYQIKRPDGSLFTESWYTYGKGLICYTFNEIVKQFSIHDNMSECYAKDGSSCICMCCNHIVLEIALLEKGSFFENGDHYVASKFNVLSSETFNNFITKHAMIMVQKNSLLLMCIKTPTANTCLVAVSQNGLLLKYVKEQTTEICMAAVSQNGLALQYVTFRTPEICMAAIKQNKNAKEYVTIALPPITPCPHDNMKYTKQIDVNKCDQQPCANSAKSLENVKLVNQQPCANPAKSLGNVEPVDTNEREQQIVNGIPLAYNTKSSDTCCTMM